MSQLFIILSITFLCARAFSITILCARAFHVPIEQERIASVRNDSVPQRKDHEEPTPAKLRRQARICEGRRHADLLDAEPKDDTTSEASPQSEDSKESDEDEKESGDSETIQRMMSLLLSTIESPGKKRGLYKFQNPDSVVKAAWVYGQSAHAHQELPVDVGEIPDSRWYPCLVANNNEDPGYQNVLCKPLENGCKRQFCTHESRLVYINSHAPQPQHFDHSTVTIKDIIEPQPEHFERSTGHCRRRLEEL